MLIDKPDCRNRLTSKRPAVQYCVAASFLLALSVFPSAAQSVYVPPVVDRSKVQLTQSWKFIASNTLTGAEAVGFDDSAWASVTVPHTWDTVYRVTPYTNSWYRTHFTLPASDSGKKVYVYFEGAFQIADVYVNGVHLGSHRGGYTRFIVDATYNVNFGADNLLAVQVNSADCSDCLPDTYPRLWKGYGGIYRKVWLLTTNLCHVYPEDFASSGVYITPSNVTSVSADVSIKTMVKNSNSVSKTMTIKNILTDRNENILLAMQQTIVVPPHTVSSVVEAGVVNNPKLWSPGAPNLYNVNVEVWADGQAKDLVTERTGFRSLSLTSSGFFLNGVSTLLRGVSKHQETEYNASAVSDNDLLTDWSNLQDLGVNYVRLVHYPHAELEYDQADSRGMLVWAENGNTNSGAETTNGDTLTREMVFQNWNHPSIVFWSAGNEASNVTADNGYAAVIEQIDSSRPTVFASNGEEGLNVDCVFYNIYPGWYSGSMYDFITDGYHFISESGAGMVVSTHTGDEFAMNFTVNSFEPEEYGQLVNEVKFQTMFVTQPSRIAVFSNWVFRDVSDVKYKDLLNTKGLLTFSNYKKDIYYLYKSFFAASPVVHIVGPHYFLRSANSLGQGDIKVYSNASSVRLTVNGVDEGSKTMGAYTHPNGTVINNVFLWRNVLRLGRNDVTATDTEGHTDALTIYYKGVQNTVPAEPGAKVQNLVSSNPASPAFFINREVMDQHPFYWDFDGNGDNTFDVVPAAVSTAGWIATKRQSDSSKTTNLSFDLTSAANIYIMFTDPGSIPSWITAAGFTDTGVTGKWRDNSPKLVNYRLFTRSFAGAAHVALSSSVIDYVVLVK
jgi:beta-galactosidase